MDRRLLFGAAGGVGLLLTASVIDKARVEVRDWLDGYDAFKYDADPTAVWKAIDENAARLRALEARLPAGPPAEGEQG